MSKKGQGALIPIVIGVVFLAFLVPVMYLSLNPTYNTANVVNESFTMGSTPVMVQLTNKDIVSGSVTVYNGTVGDVTIPATAATASTCGESSTCYYNVTYGNSYTYGTIGVNKTGLYKVTYSIYPAGYAHQSQDRATIVLVTTFLILGVLVIIAKSVGLF